MEKTAPVYKTWMGIKFYSVLRDGAYQLWKSEQYPSHSHWKKEVTKKTKNKKK